MYVHSLELCLDKMSSAFVLFFVFVLFLIFFLVFACLPCLNYSLGVRPKLVCNRRVVGFNLTACFQSIYGMLQTFQASAAQLAYQSPNYVLQ